MKKFINVRGARENNLKNINEDVPRDQIVVFTGVSGSGKSSLAFDKLYAEGQKRYVESLSAYARQSLGQATVLPHIMEKQLINIPSIISPLNSPN